MKTSYIDEIIKDNSVKTLEIFSIWRRL